MNGSAVAITPSQDPLILTRRTRVQWTRENLERLAACALVSVTDEPGKVKRLHAKWMERHPDTPVTAQALWKRYKRMLDDELDKNENENQPGNTDIQVERNSNELRLMIEPEIKDLTVFQPTQDDHQAWGKCLRIVQRSIQRKPLGVAGIKLSNIRLRKVDVLFRK